MKRFYKTVTLAASTPPDTAGFHILLDNKPVKTPDRRLLCAHNMALAEAVASEWDAQTDTINPETMPITQWVTTIQDRIHPNRAPLQAEILAFLNTDLLCYRTPDEGDTEVMGKAQIAQWEPPLQWFEKQCGSTFTRTTDLQVLTQPDAAHTYLKNAVLALDDAKFAVLLVITQGTGSIILGFAYLMGAFDAETIFNAAFVEEKVKFGIYNEEFYGSAPDQERREKNLRNDLSGAGQFLALL